MDLLEQTRFAVGERPFALWMVCAAAWFIAVTVAGRLFPGLLADWRTPLHRGAVPRRPAWTGGGAALALIPLLWFVAVSLWYTSSVTYYDAAEPTIPSVAWLLRSGEPLYHGLDSAARYSHIYGPALFWTELAWLELIGPGIRASKSIGVVSAYLGLAFLFLALRQARSQVRPVVAVGAVALAFLCFRNIAFWCRPESMLCLAVAAGLWAVSQPVRVIAVVVVAVAGAFAFGLKFTGPLYFLPIFAAVIARWGARPAAVCAGLAAALGIAPFVFEQNSIHNYIRWVQASGGTGSRLWTMKLNVEWAAFALAPCLALVGGRHPAGDPRRRLARFFVVGLLAGALGVVLLASKPGAGPYHLLPFFPSVAFACAFADREAPDGFMKGLRLGAVALVGVALLQQVYFVRGMIRADRPAAAAELAEIVSRNPGRRIEVGYGRDYRLSHYRPVVVFATGRYLLDAPAVMEEQLAGLALPPATIDLVRRCGIDLWVLPRGGEPFESVNVYTPAGGRPPFDRAFVEAFAASYHRVESTVHYDLYACRRDGAAGVDRP